jgi:hypothetical protein
VAVYGHLQVRDLPMACPCPSGDAPAADTSVRERSRRMEQFSRGELASASVGTDAGAPGGGTRESHVLRGTPAGAGIQRFIRSVLERRDIVGLVRKPARNVATEDGDNANQQHRDQSDEQAVFRYGDSRFVTKEPAD